MKSRFTLPSPALVISLVALFVALGGTAYAAAVVPLAKRALVADNAKKVGGRTAAQVGAAAAALPGPASTAASLITVRTGSFTLGGGGESTFAVPCASGEKALSGGFSTNSLVLAADTHPTADGSGWQVFLFNLSSSQAPSGTTYAVCMR